MTRMRSENLDGEALRHLIERSNMIRDELCSRGKAIDSGDPHERAKLRRALRQYLRAVPDSHPQEKHWGLLR